MKHVLEVRDAGGGRVVHEFDEKPNTKGGSVVLGYTGTSSGNYLEVRIVYANVSSWSLQALPDR